MSFQQKKYVKWNCAALPDVMLCLIVSVRQKDYVT